MPAAHQDMAPIGCLHPPCSRQCVPRCARLMCNWRQISSVPLSPRTTSALASPCTHELGSHTACLEKGPREHGNRRKEESWKISPGSGSVSRQGGQWGASHPVPGQAVPGGAGSGHAMLCPRMPNRAEPNCAKPNCAMLSHAKLGLW